ncbi:cationic peroxidase 1-like [Neltuma alba]|uniref:cationic peroxidase 1-like n=1 Tax=Neltuma alba TaxID=207710 RepID=UPI0010A478A7|nr:cationic peroxidase 1-like [Prosopis alba]
MKLISCCCFFLLVLCVINVSAYELSSGYYASTCPAALLTIKAAVLGAVLKEPRMGASLLRLHFHDCFVQGCDASILLDDTANFTGEKTAFPNVNSLRGYEVIDNIKSVLELMCPGVVSCADIVAVAARDSVVTLGGPSWDVKLGRKDSTTASLSDANRDLPAPFLDLNGLIAAFSKKGFTAQEMVALSGSHTIGEAKCATFRTRAHNDTNIEPSFATSLRDRCPSTGDDSNLSHLDVTTPNFFDNSYFRNLVNKKGLLHSDQALFDGGSSDSLVTTYVSEPWRFRADFADAMIKMSELSPLTGSDGQIRRNCRKLN